MKKLHLIALSLLILITLSCNKEQNVTPSGTTGTINTPEVTAPPPAGTYLVNSYDTSYVITYGKNGWDTLITTKSFYQKMTVTVNADSSINVNVSPSGATYIKRNVRAPSYSNYSEQIGQYVSIVVNYYTKNDSIAFFYGQSNIVAEQDNYPIQIDKYQSYGKLTK